MIGQLDGGKTAEDEVEASGSEIWEPAAALLSFPNFYTSKVSLASARKE